jgi:hypothetical protein
MPALPRWVDYALEGYGVIVKRINRDQRGRPSQNQTDVVPFCGWVHYRQVGDQVLSGNEGPYHSPAAAKDHAMVKHGLGERKLQTSKSSKGMREIYRLEPTPRGEKFAAEGAGRYELRQDTKRRWLEKHKQQHPARLERRRGPGRPPSRDKMPDNLQEVVLLPVEQQAVAIG